MFFRYFTVVWWTVLLCGTTQLFGQDYEPGDSLHFPVSKSLPPKVLHAEPLYIDLIRDLGARKGEKEWNVGMAMVDQLRFDRYEALVEYEWAPIDRLGLEIEVPVTFYAPVTARLDSLRPSNRVESFKTAAQWSFFVSPKYRTTMALGYINELEFTDLNRIGPEPLFMGNMFNPFFIVAKRWGTNWHSLIYTGPQATWLFRGAGWKYQYEFHTNIHYMIPDTRNFVGLEVNKYFSKTGADITLRPQMRVSINEHLLVGIVAGIPIGSPDEGLSSFVRLIYEPPHRKVAVKKAEGRKKTP